MNTSNVLRPARVIIKADCPQSMQNTPLPSFIYDQLDAQTPGIECPNATAGVQILDPQVPLPISCHTGKGAQILTWEERITPTRPIPRNTTGVVCRISVKRELNSVVKRIIRAAT